MSEKKLNVMKHARLLVREVTNCLHAQQEHRSTHCKGFWKTFDAYIAPHPVLGAYAGVPNRWTPRYCDARKYIRADAAAKRGAVGKIVNCVPTKAAPKVGERGTPTNQLAIQRLRLVITLVEEMTEANINIGEQQWQYLLLILRGCGVMELTRILLDLKK